MGKDASVDRYRAHAAAYPTEIKEPQLIRDLERLELADAKDRDTFEVWAALRERYAEPWAESLRLQAQLGLLNLELGQARLQNTRRAFLDLRTRYAEAPDRLKTVLRTAECAWVLSGLASQVDMRQPMRSEDVLYFMHNFMGSPDCKLALNKHLSQLIGAAKDGDIWANRILEIAR